MSNAVCFGWIIGIFLFGFGAMNLFFKDIAWDFQERSNQRRGIVNSERAPQWETTTTITGIFTIIFSIVLIILIYSQT